MDRAIVDPVAPPNSATPAGMAIAVSNHQDMEQLRRQLLFERETSSRLFTSRIYTGYWGEHAVSLVGPLIGSPYAVMLLETLVAWGVKRFVYYGWCGAVSPSVKIGDIVIPSAALVDEGTSCHYRSDLRQTGATLNTELLSRPSADMTEKAYTAAKQRQRPVHRGTVWTTDGIYRETPDKVAFLRRSGILAVEMESSALFTVAAFRKVHIGALFVVSDELASGTWRPGFGAKAFKEGRRKTSQIMVELCRSH